MVEIPAQIPVLPLRDVVVFPHMVIPLFVGREKSIEALERAMSRDKYILLVAQKDAAQDDPDLGSMYQTGTVARVLQLLKLPDNTVKVLVEGMERAVIEEVLEKDACLEVRVQVPGVRLDQTKEQEIMAQSLVKQFEQYVGISKKTPAEVLAAVKGITSVSRLTDTIAAYLPLSLEHKQQALETSDLGERTELLLAAVETAIDLLQVEKKMRGRVKKQMETSQREYYLNEQLKAIQKELGELSDGPGEIEDLAERIESAGMPKEALAKARSELGKLKMMSPMAAEATVVRNYLDWMIQVPWKKRTQVRKDLAEAQRILDEDHFGLEKVKERILEYLAVQKRVNKLKGPILCLVGPPGVGKTSLGQSIARAANRKFVRMSLGGVRDEAEIRGHRRTYIGSLPGKIVQNLAKAGVKNPVFMLDEIDKMASDFRGDPASALLEVLDPEQNHAFNDHYLEVDYDLSDVLFIATSNTLNIPPALVDRMEVIRLSGYTEDEKLSIASNYLMGKSLTNNGLKGSELSISDTAIRAIIRHYTREAGVRNLEREIAKICRKAVTQLLLKPTRKKILVTKTSLSKYLGVERYRFGRAEEENRIGQVTGLAWTEVGGELLSIEATAFSGKGNLTHTGQLGDVMQESIKAALAVVRSRCESLGIPDDFHQNLDFHVHVPEGAIPKDGPSAGIGMCTALVSVLCKIPVRAEVAMTGEITLRGEVLPIGGLKEKLLAALRGGISKVLIPQQNMKDLAEIPKNIKSRLDIVPVKWIDEVFEAALVSVPVPRLGPDLGKNAKKTADRHKGKTIHAH